MSRADDEQRYGADIDTAYEEDLRAMRREGSKAKPPAPTGNVCARCVLQPRKVHTPSGRVEKMWFHSARCPDHPGERVRIARASVQGRSWPPSRWRQG